MTAEIWLPLLVFAFGACVGSFLNVCIYRIPRGESIVRPRSHCPRCGAQIAWYDNIPLISYFLLRARCRRCGQPIRFRYVFVEALTALLFWLIWFKYGLGIHTPVYWTIVAGLILATFVDLDEMIIPDVVSLGAMALGLLLSPLFPALHDASSPLESTTRAVSGLALGSGLLWLVGAIGKRVLKKDAMGMGDVKLLGGLGALLGWQAVLFIVMVSALLGSIVGIALIVAGRRDAQSRIPYGPFLAAAAVFWILGGRELWLAYVRWLAGA